MNSILTPNQVETLLILFSRAKTRLSMHSDRYMTETNTPKDVEDAQIENDLDKWVTHIQNLPTEQPGKAIQLTDEQIHNIKRWGRFEAYYHIHTDTKIKINSENDFEHYTRELDKFRNQ